MITYLEGPATPRGVCSGPGKGMKTPNQIDAALAPLSGADVTRVIRAQLGAAWLAVRLGSQCVILRAGEQDDGTPHAPSSGATWTEALLAARAEYDLGHPEATCAEFLSWFDPSPVFANEPFDGQLGRRGSPRTTRMGGAS